jgi:hypothetical protein
VAFRRWDASFDDMTLISPAEEIPIRHTTTNDLQAQLEEPTVVYLVPELVHPPGIISQIGAPIVEVRRAGWHMISYPILCRSFTRDLVSIITTSRLTRDNIDLHHMVGAFTFLKFQL